MEEYRQIIKSLMGNAKPVASTPFVAPSDSTSRSDTTSKSETASKRIDGLQICPTKPRLNPVEELTKVLGKEQANV